MTATRRLQLVRPSIAPPRRLAPALRPDDMWCGEDREMLTCPVCGYDYCHVGDVSHQPTGKGSRVVISCWGECSHAFDMVFFQHKGQTLVAIENVRRAEVEEWPA